MPRFLRFLAPSPLIVRLVAVDLSIREGTFLSVVRIGDCWGEGGFGASGSTVAIVRTLICRRGQFF